MSKTSEAQVRAVAKYNAKNTRQYNLRLNYNTDAHIIKFLDDSGNIQGTIKAAVVDYMNKTKQF